MLEWDSVRQQKERILFEIPHLHFCHKSKDLEHFCVKGVRETLGRKECEKDKDGVGDKEIAKPVGTNYS